MYMRNNFIFYYFLYKFFAKSSLIFELLLKVIPAMSSHWLVVAWLPIFAHKRQPIRDAT